MYLQTFFYNGGSVACLGVSVVRVYELYLIEDIVANYFYGRERVFFNLFKEWKESTGDLRSILQKQIDYITRPIPTLRVHTQMIAKLQKRKDYEADNGIYYICNKSGQAQLHIEEKQLIIESSGTFEAEMVIMEALRKTEYNFFASDTENVRFGWLKPFKERKLI